MKTTEITVLPSPKFISPELLAFVRIFNMNEEQLQHWLAPDKVASDLLYENANRKQTHSRILIRFSHFLLQLFRLWIGNRSGNKDLDVFEDAFDIVTKSISIDPG